MNEKMLMQIYTELEYTLPSGWTKLLLRAYYSEGSYELKYYVFLGEKVVDCYLLPNISRRQLFQTFLKIDKIISPQRDALPVDKKWTIMTLTLQSDGFFNADFDYNKSTSDIFSYYKKWETKYL